MQKIKRCDPRNLESFLALNVRCHCLALKSERQPVILGTRMMAYRRNILAPCKCGKEKSASGQRCHPPEANVGSLDLNAERKPCAFAIVSACSASGLESATMPAPTLK